MSSSTSPILPDGQITKSCPALFAKIFRFRRRANQNYKPRRLVPHEGRIAIVTDAERDAVDAAALGAPDVAGRDEPRERSIARKTNGASRGRQSRVALAPLPGANSAEAISAQPAPQTPNP